MDVEAETPERFAAIRGLHVEAFPTTLEADLVETLRTDGDAAIALVAVDGGSVVGHVMFSTMSAPMKALGLGPIAVSETRRSRGVARALIETGLSQARAAGWEAVFVLGEPEYYGRFGFSADAAAGFETPYAGPYFMALALHSRRPCPRIGRVDYAPAFQSLT